MFPVLRDVFETNTGVNPGEGILSGKTSGGKNYVFDEML